MRWKLSLSELVGSLWLERMGKQKSCLFARVLRKLYLLAVRQQPPKIGRHRWQLHSVDFFHALQERFTQSVHPIENDSRR